MAVRKNVTDDFKKELGDVKFIIDSAAKLIQQIKATIKKCRNLSKRMRNSRQPTTALPLSGGYPLLMPRPLSLTQTTLKTLEAMQRR